ncbi:MAG TPA: ABC transporter permease [Acetobacteraceae bacterium]|nr:ABC transporter permease [Acetobacteraceae bacterium]
MSEAASIFDRGRSWRRRIPGAGFVGAAIVGAWVLIAIAAPLLAPHGEAEIVSNTVFGPMSRHFPLGTDYLGRDVLSLILYGARYTIGLAFAATALAAGAGIVLGMLAAASGGVIDGALSRAMDTLISLPGLMFALVVVASLGSSVPVLIGTASVIYMPGAFRIARSVAVDINAMEFVLVARARGEKTHTIMFEEILPNMILPVLTDFGLRFVFIVLLLSSLSFLGLGIQPPAADWGSLVRENIEGLGYGAPAVIMPAVAIATLTIGVNLVIDGFGGRRRRPFADEH